MAKITNFIGFDVSKRTLDNYIQKVDDQINESYFVIENSDKGFKELKSILKESSFKNLHNI